MHWRRVLVGALILFVGAGAVSYALTRGSGNRPPVSAPPTSSVPPTTPATTSPTTSPATTSPTTTPSAAVPAGAVLGIDTPPGNDSQVVGEVGRAPAILDGFFGWSEIGGAPDPFPRSFVDSVRAMGSTPMITWTPGRSWNPETGQGGPATAAGSNSYGLTDIAAGADDEYIRQWAEAAKSDGQTVYVRLMHEMNIAVFPWGAGVNGNTPAEYVAAFQHVVDIFRSVGATNVQFVWCVATASGAGAAPVSSYFPGDDYVSWVAMDGYNRNSASPRSFTQIFGPDYAELTSLSSRPIMIAETASVDNPTEPTLKANWIVDSFLNEVPNDFPRIKAVLYFDSSGTKFSYPITTSPESLAAIKQIFVNSYYQAAAPAATLSM